MFGLSATEFLILLIVGVVVVGPKKLPEMMRTAGQWIAKLRRLSTDLRNQSGIDRILRAEGLENELRELRSLRESLSKQAIMDTLVKAAEEANLSPKPKPRLGDAAAAASAAAALPVAAAAIAARGETTPATGPDASSSAAAPGGEDAGALSGANDEAAAKATSLPLPKPLLASDGTVATSSATSLIRPAQGTVSRAASTALPARGPVNGEPYKSFRLREYPSFGVDHYEAFPDDLEDELLEAETAALAAQAARSAAGAAEPLGVDGVTQGASSEVGGPSGVAEGAQP